MRLSLHSLRSPPLSIGDYNEDQKLFRSKLNLIFVCFYSYSHFGYSTDYCTVSGSGCSSGSSIARSNPGCIETILPDSRCYGTTGRGLSSVRATDYQPVNAHGHHTAIYCSNAKQFEKTEGFGILSAIFTIISLMSYVTDIGTDLTVCYFLYGVNDSFALGLTFVITIIPSITVNLFSIKWYSN